MNKKILILSFIVIISIFFVSKKDTPQKMYTEDYTVTAGETLWSIAKDNIDNTKDIREYIYEIRQLNELDDCIIYPNQIIKIIKWEEVK